MLSLSAPAKINLFLNLLYPREDGFHEVCFVMQSVGLYDTLTFRETDGPGLAFTCSQEGLTARPEENLVVQAYHRFFERSGIPPRGIQVHLEKRIPVQAGLGGGSSDAATMLLGLNQICGHPLPKEALSEMGALLGSDVPFFFSGATALATGRGERITPLDFSLPRFGLVILKPKAFGISTPQAYRLIREANRYQAREIEPLLGALEQATSPESIEPFLFNDFEPVLFGQYPALQDMANRMREAGIARPLLSGSGPAMVGFLEPSAENRKQVASLFPESDFEIFWCCTEPVCGTTADIP